VDDILRVREGQRLQQLVEHRLDLVGRQPLRIGFQVVERGALDVLEDEVQLPVPAKHFEQIHDVDVVAQLLQDADFAQRRLLDLLVLIAVLELLDGDDLPGRDLPRLHHDAVRALADQPEVLVVVEGHGLLYGGEWWRVSSSWQFSNVSKRVEIRVERNEKRIAGRVPGSSGPLERLQSVKEAPARWQNELVIKLVKAMAPGRARG
jgi:hypothetical protein